MNAPTAGSFSEYYKTITDTELLSILENKEDYQDAAIEAAKKELERRQLSSDQLENLKADLAEKRKEQEITIAKQQNVKQAIKERSLGFIESLNPIYEELPDGEKILRYIIILWGIFTFLDILIDFRLELHALQEFVFHPFLNSLIIFPYILLPVSLYYLWKRESLGWTLFVVFLTFSFLNDLWALENALAWRPSGIKWMDTAFKPSLFKAFRLLLIAGGTLYAMCRQDMKNLFSVENRRMWTTIGVTVAVSVLCFIGLMYQ